MTSQADSEIRQSWSFTQSPQMVWEYLTKPELIELWLGKTDFQPVKGHRFCFFSSYGNHSYCEVLEIKPYTTLWYSWQKKSTKNNEPFTSIVKWALLPKGSGTELLLVHTGFIALEDVAPHENGWTVCLNQFKKSLNT